jgi:hypothetical protein
MDYLDGENLDCKYMYLYGINSNFSIILLSLELELDIQAKDFRVREMFWLLLEPSIRKRLFKSNTINKERVLHSPTSDQFHSNQLLVQGILVQMKDSVHDHLFEKVLVGVDELGRHGSGSAFFK